MGAFYPQLSFCLIPDNSDNRQKIQRTEEMITKSGKIMKVQGKGINEYDHDRIIQMFRMERDKQYDEILEECYEFIDEIKLNIKNKKTTQEEVEEMDEVLDGLRRWLDRIKSIDWIERPAAAIKVEKVLKKCQDAMDKFTEISHPKKNTDPR